MHRCDMCLQRRRKKEEFNNFEGSFTLREEEEKDSGRRCFSFGGQDTRQEKLRGGEKRCHRGNISRVLKCTCLHTLFWKKKDEEEKAGKARPIKPKEENTISMANALLATLNALAFSREKEAFCVWLLPKAEMRRHFFASKEDEKSCCCCWQRQKVYLFTTDFSQEGEKGRSA